MQLLMGLNESFSQVRGQVLLMDLLPPLHKVYSFLIQEERQRSIGQSHGPFVESTALATKAVNSGAATGTKNYKKGKERPTCSHCGLIGHTVNKCYKIHGYPLGYKAKSRNPVANQVSCVDFGPNQIGSSNQFGLQSQQLVSQPQFNGTVGNQPVSQPQFTSTVGTQPQFGSTTHSPFTPEQYQKILAMIGGQEVASTPIGMANNVSFPLQQPTPLTGPHPSVEDWEGWSQQWTLFAAEYHICFSSFTIIPSRLYFSIQIYPFCHYFCTSFCPRHVFSMAF